jgi:hypothetical protein
MHYNIECIYSSGNLPPDLRQKNRHIRTKGSYTGSDQQWEIFAEMPKQNAPPPSGNSASVVAGKFVPDTWVICRPVPLPSNHSQSLGDHPFTPRDGGSPVPKFSGSYNLDERHKIFLKPLTRGGFKNGAGPLLRGAVSGRLSPTCDRDIFPSAFRALPFHDRKAPFFRDGPSSTPSVAVLPPRIEAGSILLHRPPDDLWQDAGR